MFAISMCNVVSAASTHPLMIHVLFRVALTVFCFSYLQHGEGSLLLGTLQGDLKVYNVHSTEVSQKSLGFETKKKK